MGEVIFFVFFNMIFTLLSLWEGMITVMNGILFAEGVKGLPEVRKVF